MDKREVGGLGTSIVLSLVKFFNNCTLRPSLPAPSLRYSGGGHRHVGNFKSGGTFQSLIDKFCSNDRTWTFPTMFVVEVFESNFFWRWRENPTPTKKKKKKLIKLSSGTACWQASARNEFVSVKLQNDASLLN